MNPEDTPRTAEFRTSTKMFRELMPFETREILLISSLYNIFNMEDGCSLTSKIIHEYKGLNLTCPPRITGVSSEKKALELLAEKEFDMVLLVPFLEETDIFALGSKIKQIKPDLPVFLIAHHMGDVSPMAVKGASNAVDKIIIWSGNPDILLALVKNHEDHVNADHDTRHGNVRVIILVEDSPEYYSYFLPVIYRQIVTQTRALLQTGLSDNQKILIMRARPKILLAKNYEEAWNLYTKYKSYLLCVISDTRMPRNGQEDAGAGITLLSRIKAECGGVPLLLMSSENKNKGQAGQIPCEFLDKNSTCLSLELRNFFLNHLGFGDFIFCRPGGRVIGRARNLKQLEAMLPEIPDDVISYHADRDHFSIWLLARSEIALGLLFRSVKSSDFQGAEDLRTFIISHIHRLRKSRQNGVVSSFDRQHFDPGIGDFVRIGSGSIGGKARGLAFISGLLCRNEGLRKKYPGMTIRVPKTLVVCTDIFEWFMDHNRLNNLSGSGFSDMEISDCFLKGDLPGFVVEKLKVFLEHVTHPLAVRSSSQREDDPFKPCAGIYMTYKIPNNHTDFSLRLSHLINAIKLVYASTCSENAKSFCSHPSGRPSSDAMAVIVQELVGVECGEYYYPSASGVAQSHNACPVNGTALEDGVVALTLGFGKTVAEGGRCLRFSPGSLHQIPLFSNIEDLLRNSQDTFYALKIKNYPDDLNFQTSSNLEKRGIHEAEEEFFLRQFPVTYRYEENPITHPWDADGAKAIPFDDFLTHGAPELSGVIQDLMDLGKKSFGGPVEIEFALNLQPGPCTRMDFYFLQIRPMVTDEKKSDFSTNRPRLAALTAG